MSDSKRGRPAPSDPSRRTEKQIGENLDRLSRLVNDSQPARPAKKKLPGPRKVRAGVPGILPREQLTKKARAAIEVYARTRSYIDVITACLKAERMRRSALYKILCSENYHWNAKLGRWIK